MKPSRPAGLFLAAAAVLCAALPSSAATNVAVFNFQMTSETPEWKWLEKGLADRIATDFVQDRSLSVVARDRMQALAHQMAWAPEMATTDATRMGQVRKQLKIEHLVTGVYSVTGEEIRITGQIVEVESRSEVARKEVTGKAADVLDLQRRLSAELLSWFSKQPPAQILKTLPVWTRSLPAAKALYEGMDLYDQGRYAEAWLKFRQASREDPDYLEATYWVGKMYYFMNRHEHARRALERFVYLDTTHPRLGDAMVEYVHTYESARAPAEVLLTLYDDMARRFPNALVWQGRSWGHFGDLRSEKWFRYKRMRLLTQLGRNEEVLGMCGPLLSAPQWLPERERDSAMTFGIANLMAHHARTGQMPTFKLWLPNSVGGGVTTLLGLTEGKTPWLRFDGAGSTQTVRVNPRRLIGEERASQDRGAVFDSSLATLALGLRAASGYVFTSLRFQALAEGTDGYLEVKLRRPDNYKAGRGHAPPQRADLPQARSQGIRFESPPRLGLLIADLTFSVKDPKSAPIHVTGVTVTAKLSPARATGTLEVSCRDTSAFCTYVDGAMARWCPGLVGPLPPGKHTVRFVPEQPGTPYGNWSTTVQIRSGQTTRLVGRLPWADGSPWAPWASVLVGTAYPRPEPSLWLRGVDETPAIQTDDKAVRLVWSFRGDLWSSVSTDGETFSPPRWLDLPVSSGWDETAPCLARDESGRFVLTFISDRDARHRKLPYVCWSRDFAHWSEPTLIRDEAIREHCNLFQDDRGRLVLDCQTADKHTILISSDVYHWTSEQIPGKFLGKDRTGLFCSYELSAKKQSSDDADMPCFRYRLLRWTSHDLRTWSPRLEVGTFEKEGGFPIRRMFALEGKTGQVILACDTSDKWELGLCEPDASGRWRSTGRMWGILPGLGRPAYHPRWGYLMASMSPRDHEWWLQRTTGPYLLRGPDLNPLREYRNPLPPLAYRRLIPKKVSDRMGEFSAQGGMLFTRIGEPFYASDAKPPTAPRLAVGELTYVAEYWGKRGVIKGRGHFRLPAVGCGTVHPKARVVTLDLDGRKMALALDAEEARAQHYDVVRLDPTGKGDFRQALRIPRTYLARGGESEQQQTRFNYQFVADLSAVPLGERQVGAGVVIEYEEEAALGSAAELAYELSTCAVGECRFGDKVYKVRFCDASNNLSVQDTARPRWEGHRLGWSAGQDWLRVDVHEDGNRVPWTSSIAGDPIRYGGRLWRINNERMPVAPYGHPILVDGRWWEVRVTDDGRHVSAEPRTEPMAYIRLGHPYWHLVLVGDDVRLQVYGGEESVPVPPGRYRVYYYTEYLSPNPHFGSAKLQVSQNVLTPPPKTMLNLTAGTTAPVQIGSPLRGTLTVTQKEGSLHFSIDLNDAGGRDVYVRSFRDREPSSNVLVKIALAAQSGQRAMTFEASRHEADDRGWKIPPGFRGTYTATVEFPPDTFPIEVKPVRVTVR